MEIKILMTALQMAFHGRDTNRFSDMVTNMFMLRMDFRQREVCTGNFCPENPKREELKL